MDSIRAALRSSKPEDKLNIMIAKIKLLLNNDLNGKQGIVLVEGSKDVNFLKNVFGSYANILESSDGKRQLHQLIKADTINDKRIIAIRDRDYADIASFSARMFVYDYCALELMLLNEYNLRTKLSSIYDDTATDEKEFPLQVMRYIAPFSVLRRKNEQEHLNIVLKDGVLKGWGKQGMLPDLKALFVTQLALDEKVYDECCKEAETLTAQDLWNITNGHDICAILGKNSKLDGKQVGQDGYLELMMLMYRKEDFCKTELYKSVLCYQETQGIAIIENVTRMCTE